jgi:hypothetical protein
MIFIVIITWRLSHLIKQFDCLLSGVSHRSHSMGCTCGTSIKMLHDYIKTSQITTELACTLVDFRNSYSYPNVRLVASRTPTEFKISDHLWAEPDESKIKYSTDLELDNYHNKLLSSADPEENLLGTASIIFWGFYTFKRKYAMNKLQWHLTGTKFRESSTPELISSVLSKINETPHPGEALSHLSKVSQLGSIPFASKVISFLRPNSAGIYDNQIHNGLMRSDWYEISNLNTSIGPVSNKTVHEGYARWCILLKKIADDLNKHIANGEKWEWTDPIKGKNIWRALDVERAFFNYFKHTKN